jgi:hypothetical protein
MGQRGDAAAAAILGVDEVPDHQLDDLIKHQEFLDNVSIEGTQFESCARRCFDLVTVLRPIEEIDVEDEEAEGTQWLSYFLSFMPSEAMGGSDFTGTFHNPDAPLVVLLGMAQARLALAEYVQRLISQGDARVGFSPKEIAYLGDVDVRTVRNAMGPKGDKPIRTDTRPGRRSDFVWGDPLDAIEWLAGRRGFHPGRLSPEWLNQHLSQVHTKKAAAALPGLVSWINRTTTEQLASLLDWQTEAVRAWTRGEITDRRHASRIASAAGLDGSAYQALIDRVYR